MVSTVYKEHKITALQSQKRSMRHFTLPGLLPSEQVIAFNPTLGTLSCLAWQNMCPILVQEEQFTTSEIYLLVPLLEAYPYYCPYEVLLANFETGQNTQEVVRTYQDRLARAQQMGEWDETVRRMRGILSRMRVKMRSFTIEIAAINETGYMLKREAQHLYMRGGPQQLSESFEALG